MNPAMAEEKEAAAWEGASAVAKLRAIQSDAR